MAVTAQNLYIELALGTTTASIPPATLTRLERILGHAQAAVTSYAANAPEATRDLAIIRLSGWLFQYDTIGRESANTNAFRQSGAAAMLAPYRRQRAQAITPDDQVTGQSGTPTPDPVTDEELDARILEWARTGNVDPIPHEKLANAGQAATDQTARDAAAAAQTTANSKDDAYAWATEGNTDAIPASKLTNAPAGGDGGGGFSPNALTGSPATFSVPNSGARTQLKATGLTGWTGGTFVLLSGPVTAAGSNHRNYSAARWIPVADLEGLTPVLPDDWVDVLRGHAFSASAGGTARGTNTSVVLPSRIDQGGQQTKADVFVGRTSTNELLISVENFGTSHTFKAWVT